MTSTDLEAVSPMTNPDLLPSPLSGTGILPPAPPYMRGSSCESEDCDSDCDGEPLDYEFDFPETEHRAGSGDYIKDDSDDAANVSAMMEANAVRLYLTGLSCALKVI